MKQQQAEKFVRDLMDMWEQTQTDSLNKFYTTDIIGHYQGVKFGLAEIRNRMLYVQKRYPKQKHYVDEVAVITPTIVVSRLRQTGIDKVSKKTYVSNLTAVYRFRKNLVCEVWVMTEAFLDYFAQPHELSQRAAQENITIDSLERRRFNEKIKDFNYFYKEKPIKLTSREEDCLYYFLNGYSAKEIGQILKITYRTVQDHLAKIKAKYGCSTKYQLRQKLFPDH